MDDRHQRARPMLALAYAELRQVLPAAILLPVLAALLSLRAALGGQEAGPATSAVALVWTSLVGAPLGAIVGVRGGRPDAGRGSERWLASAPLARERVWAVRGLVGLAVLLVAWVLPALMSALLLTTEAGREYLPAAALSTACILGVVAYLGALWASSIGWSLFLSVIFGWLWAGFPMALSRVAAGYWMLLFGSSGAPDPGTSPKHVAQYWLVLFMAISAIAAQRAYARAPALEARLRQRHGLKVLALLAAVGLPLCLAAGELTARVVPARPLGSIGEVVADAAARRIVFSAQVAGGQTRKVAWWALGPERREPELLSVTAQYARWEPALHEYLIVDKPASGGGCSLSAVRPGGTRRRLGVLGRSANGWDNALELSVSPGGDVLALGPRAGRNGSWDLLALSGEAPALPLKAEDQFLAWGADGRSVYALRIVAGDSRHTTQVRRLGAEGSDKLVLELDGIRRAVADPQRRRIALSGPWGFAQDDPEAPGLLAHLDTGHKVPLERLGELMAPAFSPDGTMLAGPCPYGKTVLLRVYGCSTGRIKRDFFTPTRQFTGPGDSSPAHTRNVYGEDFRPPPVWSPDGRRVAAQEQSGDKPWALMVFDVEGEAGETQTIALPDRPWTLQGWWPDGRLLIVARGGWVSSGGADPVRQNGQIALLDPDTGRIETLLETGNDRGGLPVAGGG